MKEKLRSHYLKVGPRRFVIGAVILLIILDILSGYSLKVSWENNQASQKMVLLSVKSMQLQMADLSMETVAEIAGLVNKTFDFMLVLLLMNNLFFYFFYLKKRLWAQGYVLFYTLSAAILSFTMVLDQSQGIGWVVFNFLTIPLYVYLYFGVKILRAETTHLPEKKGR
jgi:hypothetical protein